MRRHWGLDPEVTYLNHGAFGATPLAVLEEQRRWQDLLEANPTDFLGRRILDHLDQARGVLAAFVDADPEGLAFVRNATTGVSTVLRSLELRPGDELVVTDHAYNACRNALDLVATRSEARVRVAEVPFPLEGSEEVVKAVLSQVSERTRLVLIDHVTSPTGLVLPVERLVAELEPEVPVLVDGAHAPGVLSLSIDRLGPSYYTGNCHKWLCAPKGSAFLWVREDLRDGIEPLVVSHGLNDPRQDRSRFRKLFDWTGTGDPSAWLSVPTAIGFLGSLVPGGWDEVMGRNRELALFGRLIVCEALGLEAPAPEDMLASLAAIVLPDAPGGAPSWMVDSLTDRLAEQRIEVPVFAWPAWPRRVLRLSAQLYNTPEEYGLLAGRLGALLDREAVSGR